MNTRYYWTQDMQDVRWKTIDYDGTLIEWFDSPSIPMANMATLRWEGDKFGIKRVIRQKFAVFDHDGNNIWRSTLEENPYFKKTIKNPDIPLEGSWMNHNPFEKASPEYKSPFDSLSKNAEINRLRDRVQKLEELLDSSIQHNIELIKIIENRDVGNEKTKTYFNKHWWDLYKNAYEWQFKDGSSPYNETLTAMKRMEKRWKHQHNKISREQKW